MDNQLTGNGNDPATKLVAGEPSRVRASWPILLVAVLFVIASFLTWYFTWFGRELSDADITKYLADVKHPRHVQHALLQIQQRIDRGDQNTKQWYPEIVALASNPETEFRLTVAWLMGADEKSEEFHNALKKLVDDPEPIVRRNAALALVRHNDAAGRRELVATLEPFEVKTPNAGLLLSTLKEGSQVARGTLLARIQQSNNQPAELRSPISGIVDRVVSAKGSNVAAGSVILTLKSDEQSIWEALRGLAIVGTEDDLPSIQRYADGDASNSGRLQQQAALTAKATQGRAKFGK